MTGSERRFQAPPSARDVYARATAAWSIAALEQQLGYETRGAEGMDAEWLEAVRLQPVADLPDDDLGRLLARGLHIPILLPVALGRLRASLASRVPPDLDLIAACGRAANMLAKTAPALHGETREVLRALEQMPWAHDADEVRAAVKAALT